MILAMNYFWEHAYENSSLDSLLESFERFVKEAQEKGEISKQKEAKVINDLNENLKEILE